MAVPPVPNAIVTSASQNAFGLEKENILSSIYGVFDDVPFAVAVLKGESLVIEFINKYNLAVWDCKKEDVWGKPLFEARPEMRPAAEAIHAAVFSSGKRFTANEIMHEQIIDGRSMVRYFNAVIDPMFDEQGNIIGQLATSIEVTNQVVSRKKIEESELQLSNLADAMPQLVWRSKPSGDVTYYNNRVAEFAGAEKLEDGVWRWEGLVHPDDIEATDKAWKNALENGSTYQNEHRIQMRNGDFRWHLSRGVPEKDADGKIVQWYGTATDIHEQKVAAQKIKNSEEQLRIAIESGEFGLYDLNPQTGEMLWSSKAKELFGLPPEAEVNYEIYANGLHQDDKLRVEAAVKEALDPKNGGRYENEYRTVGIADGKLRWIRSKGRITFDDHGLPIRFTGVFQEITKQKEILISLQLQSLVLDRMDEGVSVSDENGIILFTNAAEDEMFGYKSGELIGQHVTVQNAYDPDENNTIVSTVISELKTKGLWSGEWYNRKKDGAAFYTHSFITSVVVDGSTLFVCVQRDITEEKAAREKLAFRTALLEAQNEAIPDAILIVDTKGKMLSFNQHFVTMWQIPQEIIELKDDTAALEFAMTLLVDPEYFMKRVEYHYSNPREKAREDVLFKDGRVIERYGNAVVGKDDKLYGWAWYFRDITERKLAEGKVRESEERFRSLADDSPMFVFIIDPDATASVSYWNKTWLNYTGQSAEEAIGRAWDGIIHPDDLDIVMEYYVPKFEKQESYIIPSIRVMRHDGEYRWHTFKGTPRSMADGTFNGYVGVGFDIHEQKLAEDALHESEERFRSLGNSIPQLAWMADAEGSIYWYNQRWYDYTGTTLSEMKGWGWQSVHHPDFVDKVKYEFSDAIAKGEPYEDTFLLRNKSGEYRWFLTRAVPIRNDQGEIVQWFGTNTDVSSQRETQEALKEAKEQLELTFKNVPSAIYHFDKDGKIIYLNEIGAVQLGYQTVDEVLGEKDVYKLRERLNEIYKVYDESGKILPLDQSSAALALKTGKSTEVISQFISRKDGSSFWLLSKSAPLFNEKGELTIVLTTSTDITLQKTSEKAIRESEDRFRTMAETLPQMIWIRNMDGIMEYASKNWEEYTGIKDLREAWRVSTHPDDWDTIMAVWQYAFTNGTSFQHEVRLKNKEGEYRWHYAVGEPVKDERGSVVKFIGALTDIHVQKTFAEKLETLVAERTKELQRSNEDLQQFAHVASHDLKEPVRKIITFGNRLTAEFGVELPDRAKNYVTKMESAARRLATMIDGVLMYSSVESELVENKSININDTITQIEEDLELLILRKNAIIRRKDLPSIEGSSILIYQLFYNLINNSLKFSKGDIPAVIDIKSQLLSNNDFIKFDLKGRKEEYVLLKVEDNGIGFSSSEAEKIFKTFSRLHSKDQYEGTGLGLSLCKKIVERHGGIIFAESREDEGATFNIILPLASAKRI